ncbi:hypothetical protein ACSYAD_20845 [Acaryochloris marina NIES-2412]|uniref:hypothetical protein n=1 Tax=Acaryochloris marina TaxID=155978 RepID=UPI004059AE3C
MFAGSVKPSGLLNSLWGFEKRQPFGQFLLRSQKVSSLAIVYRLFVNQWVSPSGFTQLESLQQDAHLN